MPAPTTPTPSPPTPPPAGYALGNRIESWIEAALFHSRWLLAPIYVGLILGILALVLVFAKEMFQLVELVLTTRIKSETVILLVLSLIDISLAANLVIIVMLSGYENFVSKMENSEHPDRPQWLGKIDFGGLKLKLIASIAAISAIQLLKVFVQDANLQGERIMWLVVIHLTFVFSGVMLALMDWMTAKSKQLGYPGD